MPSATAPSATGMRHRSETHVSPSAINADAARLPIVAAAKALP
jgi:hypothetical protein